MVALLKTKSGRVIQLGPDRGRLTIPLGDVSRHAAETVRTHVRHLERAANTGSPPPAATDTWLAGVSAKLHAKLVTAKLAAPREARPTHALGKFVKGYIERRTDLKPRTVKNLEQAKNSLVKHFGAGRDIGSITPGEAADWRRGLAARLAPATVSMHVKKARQFFADAIDRRLVDANPFKKLKAGTQANAERQEYVTRETILKVIDACPDIEWKLVFALARFAALRIPSELFGITFGDVIGSRMVVRATKTEHYDGRAKRVVPIDPALAPLLLEALETADAGWEHVLRRLRDKALRTQAEKIILHAGVTPWGKLWQNLRSSCETDWARDFPDYVAAAWAGNSTAVARKHYFQVTDEHYKRAALGAALVPEQRRTNNESPNEKTPVLPGAVAPELPPRGVTPRPKYPRNPKILKTALRRALRGKGARDAR